MWPVNLYSHLFPGGAAVRGHTLRTSFLGLISFGGSLCLLNAVTMNPNI